MGCRDRESNFQYTFYRPEDDKWWCSTGYTETFAVPFGYEDVLTAKLKGMRLVVRWRVTVNSERRMWEAVPTHWRNT